jgi:hypothetical protein
MTPILPPPLAIREIAPEIIEGTFPIRESIDPAEFPIRAVTFHFSVPAETALETSESFGTAELRLW